MSDDQAPSSSSRLQRVLFSTALFATVFLIASVAAAYTYGAIRGSASYAAGFDGTGSLQGFAIPQQVATAQARAVTPPGLAPNITAAEVPPLAASNSSGPTDNSTGSNTSSSSSIITSKAAARSSPAAAGTGSEEGPTKPAAEDVKPGWPSDSWEESGSACRNGLLAAPMKLFWKYHDDKTPGLTEAIHAGACMAWCAVWYMWPYGGAAGVEGKAVACASHPHAPLTRSRQQVQASFGPHSYRVPRATESCNQH